MKKIAPFILPVYFILTLLNSCKKDLDHELDYNIYDNAYTGPEPLYIKSFVPVYSTVHHRNILRINIGWNITPLKNSRVKIYKDSNYLMVANLDSGRAGTDFYALAGQTHSYQVLAEDNAHVTALSKPQSFTMY
jgi:hypothetical protein